MAAPLCDFTCGSCTQSIPPVLRSCHCLPLFLCWGVPCSELPGLFCVSSAVQDLRTAAHRHPSSCQSLRAAHLLHPASSLCILETPRVLLCPGHSSRPWNSWQLILLGAFPFLRLQLAPITEHPQGSAADMSGAPLQPRFGCLGI